MGGLSAVPLLIFMISDLDLALRTLSVSSFSGPSSPSSALLTTTAIVSSFDMLGTLTDSGGVVAAAPGSGMGGLSAVPLFILINKALALPLE